uniref:Uncharacterized protein n=1 Tax=Ditylenchus dipsaci TaxID=166011 RepID=A0A915DCN4_9BILA
MMRPAEFLNTYMDFLLSTHSISSPGHSNTPFSNSYFLYGKGDSKQMILDSQPDAFFVRMASTHPPILEFVINGGDDILVPNKDIGNLFVVLILFIAHVRKYSKHQRIGHLSLSSINLDIFDL